MENFEPLDGALLIDKPVGLTSHDVVDGLRRRFRLKKAGHCGTLDPNATGLLVVVLGKATRLSAKLMATDKVYAGTVKLGETTDTYDAGGKVSSSQPVPPLTLEQLNERAAALVGDLMQTPPMVSAAKVGGVPLYKLARKGLEVERKPRLVHVYSFQFSEYRAPLGRFRIVCTKGTYVRSLAHELGLQLGCGAHLAALRRLKSGEFSVEDAIEFGQAIALTSRELESRVIPFLKVSGIV
jgi:tRNA pseudouridine55 synthase